MKFDHKRLATETADAYSSEKFTSWVRVAKVLADKGFNVWEAEAILRSKHMRWCADCFEPKKPTSGDFANYLNDSNITPRCKEVNELVMGTFGKEYDLELNEDGVPCRSGTMPGNPGAGKVLVALGTPLCCDPTSETYWSM